MDIEARLSRYVSAELLDGATEVSPGDELLVEGLVDSLGMMRLVGYIGESLGVEVPPEDVVLENFGTIDQMAAYLRRRGL